MRLTICASVGLITIDLLSNLDSDRDVLREIYVH